MNLRWLLGNFADPNHQLPPEEQRALSDLAHQKYMPRRRFVLWTIVLLIPVLFALTVVLPEMLAWMGMAGDSTAYLVGIAFIMLLFWPWCAWVYNRVYQRSIRMAMRECGHDVCVGCGYRLAGLDPETTCCPECGRARPASVARPRVAGPR